MKTWVTIFPEMYNTCLVKNVGQFPYMAHTMGFKSRIVCYQNDSLTLRGEVPGVDVEYIDKSGDETKDVLEYIFNHAREISVLHMFHIKKTTLFPIWMYKALNPKGRIWLDTDTNLGWLNMIEMDSAGSLIKKTERALETIAMNRCTLISAPSRICTKRIASIWKLSPGAVHTIPSGYLKCENYYDIYRKERVFLSVGRLGEKVKNTELLVNAFCQTMKYHDWKLVLVGSATDKFMAFLKDRQERYNAENRLVYKGEIRDRNELYREYAKASVFVLPSRSESFGIVLCEAMSQGCYILGSDSISAHDDIIADERIGKVFLNNRLNDLKVKLLESTRSSFLDREHIQYRSSYAERFTYPQIYKELERYLVL